MSLRQYVSKKPSETLFLHVLHKQVSQIILSDSHNVNASAKLATVRVNPKNKYLEFLDLNSYVLNGRGCVRERERIVKVSVPYARQQYENEICALIETDECVYTIHTLEDFHATVELMTRFKDSLVNDIKFDFKMPDKELPPLFEL
jgi:hypothetical protein